MAQPYSFFSNGNDWMQQNWGVNAANTTSMQDTTKPVQVVGQQKTPNTMPSYGGTETTRPAQTTNWWAWYGGQGDNTNPTPNTQPSGFAQIPTPSNPMSAGTPAGQYLQQQFGAMPNFVTNPNALNQPGTTAAQTATNYVAWLNSVTPYMQLQQNAYQYAQDYNEAMRRWNEQTAWQQAADQYNMALTGRQQNMAEWQAQEAARQWEAAQAYQKQRDAAEMALSRDMTMQQVWGRNQMPNTRWIRGGGNWG